MTPPTFLSIGGTTSSAGSSTVPWGAGHQADDIGILVVQTANQTVATPAGWTLLDSIGTGTAGASGATALWVFWKRATSSAEADASVTDPGDHFRARIMVFRGCETSGAPFSGSVVKSAVASVATAVSIANPTTGVADCYVVSMVGNATLATANQTTVGAWANTDLTEGDFTRIINGNTNVGVGGGIDGSGGTKAVAGAVVNTTSTLGTASAQALIAFALKPPAGAGVTTPTEGGIYVATGVKTAIGIVNATTATMDAASVQAKVTIALKPAVAAPANTAPILDSVGTIVGAVATLVQFPISVFDVEGNNVTLSLEAGTTAVPVGGALVQDENSGNYAFEWTPTADQVGEWNFVVRATDDGVPPMSSIITVIIVIRGGPVQPPFGAIVGAITSIS
jgi:hypothetical protein